MKRAEPGLTPQAQAAYEAPFPTPESKIAARRFPDLVPTTPQMPGTALSRQALHWWRTQWTGLSFMAIGMQDPIVAPSAMHALRRAIPGGPAPLELADTGHVVQEGQGDLVARRALEAFEALSSDP